MKNELSCGKCGKEFNDFNKLMKHKCKFLSFYFCNKIFSLPMLIFIFVVLILIGDIEINIFYAFIIGMIIIYGSLLLDKFIIYMIRRFDK